MRNFNRILAAVLVLGITANVYALRVSRPQTFSLPWDQNQINQLNEYLESLWYVQNGRIDLDIVTTSKTNARNGEIWILNDSGTYKLEFKANDAVHTITP